jgi:magnesium transporter
MKLVSKYSLLAVPVVSKDMTLVGNIVIDDIVYQVLKRKRAR